MRVFKNLFGDNSKLHIDNVALKKMGTAKLLSDSVIVEEGSNANGSYIRFGNGYQICVCLIKAPKSADTTGNFPASFLNDEIGLAVSSAVGSYQQIRDVGLIGVGVSSHVGFRLMKNSRLDWDFPDMELHLRLLAIGPWK